MRRREFITLVGCAVIAWPLGALAQQGFRKPHRIGLLTRAFDASVSNQVDAFRQGLRDLGWVEGESVSIEYRDAERQLDRLPALAAELVLSMWMSSSRWTRRPPKLPNKQPVRSLLLLRSLPIQWGLDWSRVSHTQVAILPDCPSSRLRRIERI